MKEKHTQQQQQVESAIAPTSDIYFDKALNKLIVKGGATNTQVKRKKDKFDEEMDSLAKEEGKTSGLRQTERIVHKPEDGPTYASKVLEKYKKRDLGSSIHNIRESGEGYKATRGTKGDMLIPGRPDPHAFVQLNPLALKMKYRDRAAEVFDFLVNRKKVGTLKGLKKTWKK